jgi:hypothetical protein
MRVQGTNTAIAGPLGALPVPVPQRDDGAFRRHLTPANAPIALETATVYGPLALSDTPSVRTELPSAVPRLDASRAYARSGDTAAQPVTGRGVSIKV